MKIKNAADLDSLYQKADEADRQDFAKMRSGLLLIAGEHYNRKSSKFFDRVRTSADVSDQAKIRISKNHLGRIVRRYSNQIITSAPGVVVGPKYKGELQSIKAAELNQSVWSDGKEKSNWVSMNMQWADDFTGIGEVWTKLYFDETAGPVVGQEEVLNEMNEVVGVKDILAGQLKFEELFAFNVLRDPTAQNIKDSSFYCIRKAVPVERLRGMFPDQAQKINATNEAPFLVFDVGSGYRKGAEEEVLVKEWYFRPSPDQPNGYFYIAIAGVILEEGELPGGIFPIVCERMESIQTKARGISSVEPLRPYQAEINRCASKIAEHQITLGDDKLIMVNGAKMSAGGQVPGVRGVTVSGGTPIIMPGRSGSQYLDYMLAQVKEMYEMAELDEDDLESNLEPHTLLYRAASQKRKFSRYIKRFECFLKEVCQVYLRMAKYYYTPETVISAVGRAEIVNIEEFKNTKDQSLEIVIEPMSDDIETKLGQQLVINHVLQYVGSQLDSQQLGKLIQNMPYANVKDAFTDITSDDSNATNDILALDRGEYPIITPSDNHEYLIDRITTRMRQTDYKTKPEEIQALYEQYYDEHMAFLNQQKEEAQRATSGFVPDGGAMVGVDFFIQDPNNPERTRRARIPYDAVSWLVAKLQDQGTFKRQMEDLPLNAQADMAEKPMAAEGSQAEVVPPSSATL